MAAADDGAGANATTSASTDNATESDADKPGASPGPEKPNMVGVILYDVSNTGGAAKGSALSNALDNLPATLPVLNITAEPAPVNLFGDANPALAEKRPGQFNGIQLVGGAHSDAFRSSTLFGIPQLLVTLLFGASTPENVEAVHVLTQGWLTDMYEHRVYNTETRTGFYGDPGDPGEVIVDIPTDAGPARGYVLPAPIRVLSPIDQFIATLLGLINVNYYATCVGRPRRIGKRADRSHVFGLMAREVTTAVRGDRVFCAAPDSSRNVSVTLSPGAFDRTAAISASGPSMRRSSTLVTALRWVIRQRRQGLRQPLRRLMLRGRWRPC